MGYCLERGGVLFAWTFATTYQGVIKYINRDDNPWWETSTWQKYQALGYTIVQVKLIQILT